MHYYREHKLVFENLYMSSSENNAEIPSSMKRLPTHLLSIIMLGGLKFIWVKTNRQVKTFSVLDKN